MTPPTKRESRGCLFYALIILGGVFVVLALATYLGMRTARQMIDVYTDKEPAPLPVVELPPEEMEQLQARVRRFQQEIRQQTATNPLVLSSREINALIATTPQAESLRGKLHVMLEGSEPKAQISVSLDQLGLPVFRGRYLNGIARFEISTSGGLLRVSPADLQIKGKSLPSVYMNKIRKQNLAAKVNEDPRSSLALEKIGSIEVVDGKLVITPAPEPLTSGERFLN